MAASVLPDGIPLLREVVHAGLGRIFGPPPFDPDTDPGDPGLFGPASASWRVIGEPSSIVGGVRALLVQTLHPLAVAGVADHSQYREDPLRRLHRTSAYVTTTTFGSLRDAIRVARQVRAAHHRVVGAAPDGRPYAASRPDLLTVVSVALTASFLAADRAYSPRPVDAATADAFVAEQARAAALLDPRVDLDIFADDPAAATALRAGGYSLPMLDDGTLPVTVAELDATMARLRREFAVTQQTRDLFVFLLRPQLPAPILAAYIPILSGALATLDPADLRLMGVPSLPGGGRLARMQTRVAITGLRLATGGSPSRRAAVRRTEGRSA